MEKKSESPSEYSQQKQYDEQDRSSTKRRSQPASDDGTEKTTEAFS